PAARTGRGPARRCITDTKYIDSAPVGAVGGRRAGLRAHERPVSRRPRTCQGCSPPTRHGHNLFGRTVPKHLIHCLSGKTSWPPPLQHQREGRTSAITTVREGSSLGGVTRSTHDNPASTGTSQVKRKASTGTTRPHPPTEGPA